jgi:hypothetical protein
MSRRDKLFVLAIGAGILAIWLVLQPGCPFRNLTGIPCPGCGMSRAWLAALRLEWGLAFDYHPMFWAVPVLGWMFWWDFRPFRRNWINFALLLALCLGLVVCYGYRMSHHLIH